MRASARREESRLMLIRRDVGRVIARAREALYDVDVDLLRDDTRSAQPPERPVDWGGLPVNGKYAAMRRSSGAERDVASIDLRQRRAQESGKMQR